MTISFNPFSGTFEIAEKNNSLKPELFLVGNEPIEASRLVGLRQGLLVSAVSSPDGNIACLGFVRERYAAGSVATVFSNGTLFLDYSIDMTDGVFLSNVAGMILPSPKFARRAISQKVGFWLSRTSVFIDVETPIVVA